MPATGPRSRVRLRSAPWAYLVPAVVVLGLLSIYPLVVLIQMAVSDVSVGNILGPWTAVGLANLRAVMQDPDFWKAFRVSLKITAVVFIGNMVVGYVAAAFLSGDQRTSRWLVALIVFVWALPPLVGGSVWKFILQREGLVNELLGLVGIAPVGWLSSPDTAVWTVSMVSAWASLPFAIVVYRSAILSVPVELLEAAEIDGASYWRRQISIIIPMIRTPMLILGTLTLLYAFRSFDIVYVMTRGGPGSETATLSVFAYQTAFENFSFSYGSAVSVVAMCVMMFLVVPYAMSVRREEQQ